MDQVIQVAMDPHDNVQSSPDCNEPYPKSIATLDKMIADFRQRMLCHETDMEQMKAVIKLI